MNYSGKFDAKTPSDGLGLHSPGHVHVETVHATQVPADAIVVEDAHLLFNAQFKRSGVDLVLSKDDSELVLHDYFKGEKRATLASPDGAHLTGDVVNALAGNVQYAQATDGNTGAGKIIGHVSKLAGTATATRNGVAVILHNGDNVEKGDVVESGASSTLGITFIDGTVFGLSSNARMVLNEMVYDPNGSNNSSLLSLVAGTITFVAGETAKHGDMKVDTPVATMGIRGTAVLCEIDFLVPGQGTPDAKFQVLIEPDGTTGSYILFDKTTLTPLAVVDTAGTQINISNGILSQTSAPLSPEVQKLIQDVFSLKFSDNSNTRSLDNHTDTLIPQSLVPIKLASGVTAFPLFLSLNSSTSGALSTTQNGPGIPGNIHIDQPPTIALSGDAALTVHTGASQATGFDTVSGTVSFTDINAGDLPTVSTKFVSFKLFDAQHNDITATLTSQQQAQIAAVEAQPVVTPSPGNNNNGSATWTYSVADTAFNFLTAGETLALTYNAIVDNNFPPQDLTASAPFTITISGPSNVEWIHPTSGLWSVGSNWSTGSVPTASDDAIIPAQNIPGGTGLYNVTIEAPAFARNLTLNANDTTGAQVTNDSTLTVGQMLTIFNDGVLNNSGTVTVGKLELFDQSLLQNSGLVTLDQGGDFTESITIVNSGTIVLAGGTLNVQVDIENSGGTIQLDSGTTLNLNGVNIDGGTINDDGFGAINFTADSSINGGEGGAVLNNGEVTLASGVTLTLDDVTANDTAFNDLAAGSTIQVDIGDTLTLDGVTVDGGTINDNGTIDVTADSLIDGGESSVVLNNGVVTVESDVTLTLDNVTANTTRFNDLAGGTLQVDEGSTLNLNGAVVNGGTITDNGTIDINGAVTFEGGVAVNGGVISIARSATLDIENPVTGIGASLNGVSVMNSGTIQVDSVGPGTTVISLLLDEGTTVTGGTLLIHVGFPINGIEGAVEIGTGGAFFNNLKVANNNFLTVDDGDTLTLSQVTFNGGTINNGTPDGAGMMDVVANSSINGVTMDIGESIFTANALLNNGGVTVASGVTLTLDNVGVDGTVFTDADSSSVIQIDDGDTVTLSHVTVNGGTINNGSSDGAGGTIDVLGDSSINGISIPAGGGFAAVEAEGATTVNAVLNDGGVSIGSEATLTLDNVTVNHTVFTGADASSTIQVDGGDTIVFNGGAIDGGTLNVFGELDSTGTSFITGAVIINAGNIVVSSGTLTIDPTLVTNTGTIQVTGDSSLVLSQSIVTNTGGTIEVDGIDPTHFSTLNLDGTAINGGAVVVSGLLVSTGLSSINGAAITSTGPIDVTSGILTVNAAISFDNGSTLEADGAELDLIGTIVTSTGTVEATGASGILNLNNAAINGGTVLTANSTDVMEATGGVSTIGNTSSFINNGTVETLGAELDLVNANVVNNGSIIVDVTAGMSGTLNLQGASISGGSVSTAASTDVIEATAGVSTIVGTTSFVNVGTVEANGAELDLVNTTVTNTGTVESAGTGGVLNLKNVTIDGGAVATASSTDVIEATSGVSTINGAASFVNNGTLETLGAELDLVNTAVTNNGALIVDLTGGLSGTLKLQNASINGGSVSTAAATDVIEATGGVSKIGGTDSFVNNGTLEALGAELDLVSSAVTNNGSVIVGPAGESSGILKLESAAVSGGTLLTTSSADVIEATSGVSTISQAGIFVNNGTSEAVGAELDLVNTAVINIGTVEATGASGILNLNNAAINGGTVLTANSTDVIEATGGVSTIGNTSSFINNGTVETLGAELDLVNANVVNNGSIIVDVTAGMSGTLNLQGASISGGSVSTAASTDVIEATSGVNAIGGTGSFINNGMLEVLGAELDLVNTTVTNNGTVFVDAIGGPSGVLDLQNATINGGTIETATPTDQIEATSGVSTISGTATFFNAGMVEANGGELDLVNTAIANNGTIASIGTGVLNLRNVTINGGTLAGPGRIATAAGNTESILSGVTIAASTLVIAVIGALDLTGAITNKGEVDATTGQVELENVNLGGGILGGSGRIATAGANIDSTLSSVTVAGGSTVTAAVGTLDLTGTITNNGQIDATTGKIDFENATLNGGTLGGGGIIATVSGANALSGVTIAVGATIQVTDTTSLELLGTIANGGTIALNSSGDVTQLKISGNVVLDGGGQVALSDNTNNFIVSDGSAATLNNFDTITGAGTIGDSSLTLVNSGTVDATGTHALIIDTGINTITTAGLVGSILVTNNAGGILEASAGHTLQIDDNVLNNGLIQAGNLGSNSAALVDITGNITGTGSIELFNNAKLEIGGTVSSGQTVTFGAAGAAATLILDDSHGFRGTIVGLTEFPVESQENHVDLKDLQYIAGHMHAHFSDGVVTVSNGIDSVSLKVSGNSDPAFEIAADSTGGTLIDDPSAAGNVTIDSGKTLDISAASAATVSFTNGAGNTGELVLDSSSAFTGKIIGFAGDGTMANSDLIDLADVNIADVAINRTTYTDDGNGSGTLTLYNANGQALDSIQFAGNYQLANFTIENDGSGQTLIVDPPVAGGSSNGGIQSAGGIVMHDPGQATTGSVVASAPNQMLTGSAPHDNFVFNFAGVGHATVTDFHPDTDALQFKSSIFANALAALNAAHDDGHGDCVIAIDAHDAITLSGVIKAQLHATDFHVV